MQSIGRTLRDVSAAIARAAMRLFKSTERVVRFLGPISFISTILLIVVGVLFFRLWRIEEWRVYISAIAAGIAALLGASAGLMGEKERGRWLLAAAGGVLITWVTSYTNADLTTQVKYLLGQVQERDQTIGAQNDRLTLLKADAVDYLKSLPQADIDHVLTLLGVKARDRFNYAQKKRSFVLHDFDSTEDIVQIIFGVSENNGHALYIQGLIERSLNYPELGRQRFYAYIEAENGAFRDGQLGYRPCHDNPKGFCQERTAWVFHLLANDYYQQGKTAKEAGDASYKSKFATALKHACSAIKLFPNDGFDDPTQAIPSRRLETLLRNELGVDCSTRAN